MEAGGITPRSVMSSRTNIIHVPLHKPSTRQTEPKSTTRGILILFFFLRLVLFYIMRRHHVMRIRNLGDQTQASNDLSLPSRFLCSGVPLPPGITKQLMNTTGTNGRPSQKASGKT